MPSFPHQSLAKTDMKESAFGSDSVDLHGLNTGVSVEWS